MRAGSPVASLVHFLGFLGGFFGARADPGVVEKGLEFGAGVPAAATDSEKKLRRAAGVDADFAEAFAVDGERDAGGTAANQGDVETWVAGEGGDAFFEPGEHGKPVGVGVGRKAVRAFKCEQFEVGEQAGDGGPDVPAFRILGANGVFERVDDEDAFPGERGRPRSGRVEIRFEGGEIGPVGAWAEALSDLEFAGVVPEGAEIEVGEAFGKDVAEMVIRAFVFGKDTGLLEELLFAVGRDGAVDGVVAGDAEVPAEGFDLDVAEFAEGGGLA